MPVKRPGPRGVKHWHQMTDTDCRSLLGLMYQRLMSRNCNLRPFIGFFHKLWVTAVRMSSLTSCGLASTSGDAHEHGRRDGPGGAGTQLWPWLVLALMVVPAVWHVLDFDEDIDPEFPKSSGPAFSAVPPAAYRLAEPGDTLDRVEIYLSAAGVMVAAGGLAAGREDAVSGRRRWRSAWPAFWYSATPGPTVDGWHGLGWRTIANPARPDAAFA